MTGSTLFLNNQQFSDFSFSPLDNFGNGSYILIEAGNIQGSLGSNLQGSISGLPASLSISGNNLVLNVVPEPSTIVLFCVGAISLLTYYWRLKIHQRIETADSRRACICLPGRHLA